MALLAPISLRSNPQFTPAAEVEQPQESQPQEPAQPAALVPGATDSVETTDEARRRSAQDAVLGNQTPEQRGIQAARTLDEVRNGIDTRNLRLASANRQVERLETRLGEQLMNLAPSMTQDQRQQYADAYRQRNDGAYAEARTAAQDLASYTRDSLPRLEQASRDIMNHPMRGATGGMTGFVARSMQESVRQLDTAVRQSPTGSEELSRTLGQLGTQYQQLADRANRGDGVARPLAGGLAMGLNQLSQDVQSIARRAAGAFGAAAGALGAVDNAGRLVNGTGREEHVAGLAANGAQIAGGVLRVAGVAIGGPISLVAGGAALIAGGVSAYRDRQEYVRDVSSTLQATGVDARGADALARSNPESLRRLAAAGFTPEQIREVTAAAPNTARMHVDQVGALPRAAERFGLTPAQMTDLVRQLGPRADPAIDALGRAMSVNPDGNRERILRELQSGWGANEASRIMARLLQAQ